MKLVSIVVGVLFFIAGIYFMFLPEKRTLVSPNLNSSQIILKVKETVPCYTLAPGVPPNEAIEITYSANLQLDLAHEPNEFKSGEGLITSMKLTYPQTDDVQIIYRSVFGDEDITSYIKNPVQIGAPASVTAWGRSFQRALESETVRNALLGQRASAAKLLESDGADSLTFYLAVAGAETEPKEYRTVDENKKLDWSVFLPDAATYRGIIHVIGKVSSQLPEIKIPTGVLNSHAELVVPDGTTSPVEYDVSKSKVSEYWGYILGALGIFIASFPAWLPILRST